MDQLNQISIYEMTVNLRVTWQAHSLSNNGTNGSNRLLPRRQMLADSVLTDACSGSILKHYNSVLTAEYLESFGTPLCPACATRDARRAAALVKRPGYQTFGIDRAITECGLCDIHGFLVTGKNAGEGEQSAARQRVAKHSLVEHSMALALPEHHAETEQVNTRAGDSKESGQMILKHPSRSGQYGECIRYKAVGIGVDTEKWRLVVSDAAERLRRHRAVLSALRDQILSPSGAQTATMLPHLSGLVGAVVVRKTAGRAPLYSPLCEDFVARLQSLSTEDSGFFPFNSVDEFNATMSQLIQGSVPATPKQHEYTDSGGASDVERAPELKSGRKKKA